MKKILAIGASNSKQSINKTLATYVANKILDATVTIADLNELELPLFSPDLEAEKGIPKNAEKFLEMISNADGIVLSLAEYNSNVTPAFKNLCDWTSRLETKLWKNKPMFLMATSPGGRGGASVLKIMKEILPHLGGNIIADFSMPSFQQNFSANELTNNELKGDLERKIALFQKAI